MIRYALPVRPILGDSKYLYSNFRALCRPTVCYYYVCVFPLLTLFSVSLVAATEFQFATRYTLRQPLGLHELRHHLIRLCLAEDRVVDGFDSI
jgi:hypothetical protein